MAQDVDDPTGLVGEALNSVAFVMDYVEFGFNGPVLRALTNPVVQTPEGRWQFAERGSRDALCSLIGSEVLEATVRDEDGIALTLTGGMLLTIPLDRESRSGPEAAHFVPSSREGRLRVADMLVY
jgi:hypothetical protein